MNIYVLKPLNDSIRLNKDSIFTDVEFCTLKRINEYGFSKYEQIDYDTLGRVISKKYDFGYVFMHSKQMDFIEKTYSYPDEETTCISKRNPYFFNIAGGFYSGCDSTIYQYFSDNEKLKNISFYCHYDQTAVMEFNYRPFLNYPAIIVMSKGDRIVQMEFYEFIYYEKKK